VAATGDPEDDFDEDDPSQDDEDDKIDDDEGEKVFPIDDPEPDASNP
jgi:hypothetical protein